MVHQVPNNEGDTVTVLGLEDLNSAKDAVIGWLVGIFGATILAAVSLAVYATSVRAQVDAVDTRVIRLEGDSLTRRNLDSLRLEVRHMSYDVQQIKQLLERR